MVNDREATAQRPEGRGAGIRPVVEDEAEPTGIHRFRQTASGTVLAAGLLGLADALEGPRDEEVAIVTEFSGDPPFSDPIVMRLDPDAPQDSIVLVRRPPESG